MARNLYLVTLFLLLCTSGCAILRGLSESDVETAEKETPTASFSEQPIEPIASDSPTPANDETSRAATPLRKPLSREEIRRIQGRLKVAGFDPGPIDGILGPKTRTVLFRVQAGCAIVNDLVGTSDTQIAALVADAHAPELTNLANQPLNKEEIRLLQEQLKVAGFDPGPADGILGPTTRAAISRCKSGCTALADLLGSSDQRALRQTTAIQSPPASGPEKPAQPVVYSSPPKESVKHEASKPAASVSNTFTQQEIRLAQERLKDAGFDPGPADGILGPKTISALEKYRSHHGLIRSSGIEALLGY